MAPSLSPDTPILPANTIENRDLDRSTIEKLSKNGLPHKLIDCLLEEADLSRLTLDGWGVRDLQSQAGQFHRRKTQRHHLVKLQGRLCRFHRLRPVGKQDRRLRLQQQQFQGRDTDRHAV